MRWVEVEVRAGAGAEEPVAAALLASGSQGVSISSKRYQRVVLGYFLADDRLADVFAELRRRLTILQEHGVEVDAAPTACEVEETDWATAWKAFYKPIHVGRRIVVKPTWESYDPAPGEIIVELDPGMAFGTGEHPTTQLCMELLEERVRTGDRILDWGTGSGILAITAAKLGAARIDALDLDAIAVEAARANAIANSEGDRILVVSGDLGGEGRYDGVVANILPDPVIEAAAELRRLTRAGGWLIVSGIVSGRRDDVERALARAGFRLAVQRERSEWVAMVFE